MSHKEQIDAFSEDVGKLIDRYRAEFDLPLAVAVGVLNIHATHLTVEALKDLENNEE